MINKKQTQTSLIYKGEIKMLNKNESYELALMQEMEILVELLENSNDEAQQKAIISMLCDMVKYLNHNKGVRK